MSTFREDFFDFDFDFEIVFDDLVVSSLYRVMTGLVNKGTETGKRD